MKVNSEEAPVYGNMPITAWYTEDELIAKALEILNARMYSSLCLFSSPRDSRHFLALKLAELEHEVFGALWLTAQNQLIAYEELFRGSLTEISVYPREILKTALKHNAAAVIFAHNHPSGHPEPSHADKLLTNNLKTVLALVDIKVLDHIIVGGTETLSFSERGLL